MNTSRLLFGTLVAMLLVVIQAYAADKSPKLPAFPGQPNINTALKQLNMAKDKMETKPEDSIAHLKLALNQLEGSKSNRGSFRATAIRLNKQAIKHLEAKDVPTAKHEIEEALENVVKAGEAGEKK